MSKEKQEPKKIRIELDEDGELEIRAKLNIFKLIAKATTRKSKDKEEKNGGER